MIPTRLSRPFGRPSPPVRWRNTVSDLRLLIQDQVTGRVEIGYAARLVGCDGRSTYSFQDGSACMAGDGVYLAQRSDGLTVPLNWDFGPAGAPTGFQITSATVGSTVCGTRQVFVDGATHGCWTYAGGLFLGRWEDIACGREWYTTAEPAGGAGFRETVEFWHPDVLYGNSDGTSVWGRYHDVARCYSGVFARRTATDPPNWAINGTLVMGSGLAILSTHSPYPPMISNNTGLPSDYAGRSPFEFFDVSGMVFYVTSLAPEFAYAFGDYFGEPIGTVAMDVSIYDAGYSLETVAPFPETLYSWSADPSPDLWWAHLVGDRTLQQYGYRAGPTDVPTVTDGGVGAGPDTPRFYRVTYTDAGGETAAGPPSLLFTPTTLGGSAANVTLPIGPAGTTARTLYRGLTEYTGYGPPWFGLPTSLGYKRVATVTDNVTATLQDAAMVGSEGPAIPSAITTPQTRTLVGGPWTTLSYIDRIDVI